MFCLKHLSKRNAFLTCSCARPQRTQFTQNMRTLMWYCCFFVRCMQHAHSRVALCEHKSCEKTLRKFLHAVFKNKLQMRLITNMQTKFKTFQCTPQKLTYIFVHFFFIINSMTMPSYSLMSYVAAACRGSQWNPETGVLVWSLRHLSPCDRHKNKFLSISLLALNC